MKRIKYNKNIKYIKKIGFFKDGLTLKNHFHSILVSSYIKSSYHHIYSFINILCNIIDNNYIDV